MLGNLTGPMLLVLIAVVLLVLAGIITWAILYSVRSSNRSKAAQQAELQRAYEAGLSAQQRPSGGARP